MTKPVRVGRKKKRLLFAAGSLILAAALGVWIAWGNTALVVTELTVTSARLPHAFEGFRMAQVSDLHNGTFGEDNRRLIEELAGTEPDCVVLTGDLVDSRHTDMEVALSFGRQAAALAPTYYVTGNHEARIDEIEQLKTGLEEAGVVVLENESVLLERAGAAIALAGVGDPSFYGGTAEDLQRELERLPLEENVYTVLLSHRPEYFALYGERGIDLVLTGHSHGGQFRVPGLGGLWAPGQGLFPPYDAGLYERDGTAMVVSRGVGNSLFPFRVNNRPEIVVVTLGGEP